jgi:hypothetical protein
MRRWPPTAAGDPMRCSWSRKRHRSLTRPVLPTTTRLLVDLNRSPGHGNSNHPEANSGRVAQAAQHHRRTALPLPAPGRRVRRAPPHTATDGSRRPTATPELRNSGAPGRRGSSARTPAAPDRALAIGWMVALAQRRVLLTCAPALQHPTARATACRPCCKRHGPEVYVSIELEEPALSQMAAALWTCCSR